MTQHKAPTQSEQQQCINNNIITALERTAQQARPQWGLNRGSYTSAYVLLNILNELKSLAFYLIFATSLINSFTQKHEC